MKILITIILVLMPFHLIACKCSEEQNLDYFYSKYSNVAIVKVLTKSIGAETKIVNTYDKQLKKYTPEEIVREIVLGTAEVVSILKGNPSDIVRVNAGMAGTSCTDPLIVGEQYLAFIDENNEIFIGYCRASRSLGGPSTSKFIKNKQESSNQKMQNIQVKTTFKFLN